MEEGIKDILSPGVFRGFFPIEKKDGISALGLAYIGDAVFELMVRLYMAGHGSMRVEKLHKRVTETVNAGTQSRISYHRNVVVCVADADYLLSFEPVHFADLLDSRGDDERVGLEILCKYCCGKILIHNSFPALKLSISVPYDRDSTTARGDDGASRVKQYTDSIYLDYR